MNLETAKGMYLRDAVKGDMVLLETGVYSVLKNQTHRNCLWVVDEENEVSFYRYSPDESTIVEEMPIAFG